MRIRTLGLERYGHFTGRTMEFPRGDRDFHMLVGANEAGKSTVRNALRELLFGIDKSSAYGWKHGYTDMRLAATLEGRGSEYLEIVRSKGYKNTLRTPSGDVLSESVLQALLGRVDERLWERMFSLDVEALVTGGQSLLDAEDDVGRLLFQSASGLVQVGDLARRLSDKAESQWGPKKKAGRGYHDALEAYESAEAALKASVVRSKDYGKLVDECVSADAKETAARVTLDQARTALARVDRIRRVRPALERLARAERDLAECSKAWGFGATDRELFDQARAALEAAQETLRQEAKTRADLEAQIAALAVDEAMRNAARELAEVNVLRIRIEAAPEEVSRAQGAVEAGWRRLEGQLRSIGIPADGPEAVRRALGSATAIKSARAAMKRLAEKTVERSAAERDVAAKQLAVNKLLARLSDVADTGGTAKLEGALAEATSLGSVAALRGDLVGELDRAEGEQEQALARLGVWRAGYETLVAMVLPDEATATEVLEVVRAAEAEQRALRDRAAEEERSREALARALRHEGSDRLMTDERVQSIRQERDAVWTGVQANPGTLRLVASELTSAIAAADDAADARFAQASEISRVAASEARLAEVDQLLEQLAQQQQDQQGVISAAQERWEEAARQAGIVGMEPGQLSEWRRLREKALECFAESRRKAGLLKTFDSKVTAACQELSQAIEGCGEVVADGAGLPELIAQARAIKTRHETVAARGEEVRAQLADAEAEFTTAQEQLSKLTGEESAYKIKWGDALEKCGIVQAIEPDEAEAVLAALEASAADMAKIETLQRDVIDKKEGELAVFRQRAEALLGRLGRSPREGQTVAEAVAFAHDEAVAAEHSATTRAGILERQSAVAESERAAQVKVAEERSRIASIAAIAGTDDLDQIAVALREFERTRQATADLEAARREVEAAGDGMTVEAIVAEAAGEKEGDLVAKQQALKDAEQAAADEVHEAAVRAKLARGALDAVSGSADAAVAEGARQEAIARMVDAMDEYFRARAGELLLKWAMERFRNTQQGPMLRAASQYFGMLTRGSFEKLVVDFEEQPPKLEGRRREGSPVGLGGMSEGTRNQLFLALRLAAIDSQIEAGTVVPFIADDLFVHFDDERSQAGFEALARLSERTQVLFMTHHRHLVPRAKAVFGDSLSVIEVAEQG